MPTTVSAIRMRQTCAVFLVFHTSLNALRNPIKFDGYAERLHKYSGRSRVIRGWKEGGADWSEEWMDAGREARKEAGREGEREGRTGWREKGRVGREPTEAG